MRSIHLLSHALTLLFLMTFTPSYGQPSGINYQAVLAKEGGVIANSDLAVRFTLLENGSAVYQELHTTSSGDRGEFSAIIGGGVAESGSFSSLDWTSRTLRLRVDVDLGNGFTEISNKPFQSVPYSLVAERVRTLPNISLDSQADVQIANPSTGDEVERVPMGARRGPDRRRIPYRWCRNPYQQWAGSKYRRHRSLR